jgi:hypothetical protein
MSVQVYKAAPDHASLQIDRGFCGWFIAGSSNDCNFAILNLQVYLRQMVELGNAWGDGQVQVVGEERSRHMGIS